MRNIWCDYLGEQEAAPNSYGVGEDLIWGSYLGVRYICIPISESRRRITEDASIIYAPTRIDVKTFFKLNRTLIKSYFPICHSIWLALASFPPNPSRTKN